MAFNETILARIVREKMWDKQTGHAWPHAGGGPPPVPIQPTFPPTAVRPPPPAAIRPKVDQPVSVTVSMKAALLSDEDWAAMNGNDIQVRMMRNKFQINVFVKEAKYNEARHRAMSDILEYVTGNCKGLVYLKASWLYFELKEEAAMIKLYCDGKTYDAE